MTPLVRAAEKSTLGHARYVERVSRRRSRLFRLADRWLGNRCFMIERKIRIAANEALFREVNEQREELNSDRARQGRFEVVCECGAGSCSEPISIRINDYELVRSHSTWFIVKPGHEIEDVEDVVQWHDTFNVVEKRAGRAAELVREADPRG